MDIDAADERGIYVCNCKGMNAAAVSGSRLALLMLGLLRDVAGGDRSVRAGEQIAVKEAYMMAGDFRELGECRVGLIGLGDIGKADGGVCFQRSVPRSSVTNRTGLQRLMKSYTASDTWSSTSCWRART